MAFQFTGYTTIDIYQSVINDVINGLKETFLDDDVDLDVLSNLKKDWEQKVEESCDWDKKPDRVAMLCPPPQRSAAPVARILAPPLMPRQEYPVANVASPLQHVTAYQAPGTPMEQYQYVPETGMTYQTLDGRQVRLVQTPIRVVQQQQIPSPGMGRNAPPRLVQLAPAPMQHPQRLLPVQTIQPQHVMYVQSARPDQNAVPMGVRTNLVPQQRQQQPPPQQQQVRTIPHSSMYQLDGNGDRVVEEEGKPTSKEAKKVLAKLLKQLQLDGGRNGAGMSDSSSDEDEDLDPLRRLADKIGGAGEVDEDAENIVEEDPLNSDDDEDDEDMERLFEVENVIICQFEKIHRARNKWKMQLKDGIMRIENRDTCFFKATGDAEF